MKFKVIIPTAGLGSRLKSLSKNVNKALVTVAHKPTISYIIEKFPGDVEFVIPLGYKSDTVRDYLQIAHPERRFVFVEVDKYEGQGSGLGYTLLLCREHLECPFVFCSNDTIVTDEVPNPEFNWMGYAKTGDTENYRSIRFESRSRVTEICSKGATGSVRPYIGLAGIRDYAAFWAAMEGGRSDGAIEIGESYGFRFLIDRGIEAVEFNWFDTGNLESLTKSRAHYRASSDANILEKEDEAIWFVNDKVIKFSIDKEFIANRIRRAPILGNYVPEIVASSKHMYAYRRVEGEVFSKNPNPQNFRYFLEWMHGFWTPISLNASQREDFRRTCTDFYKTKTLQRVKQYFTKFEQLDCEETINNVHVPRLANLLEELDWDDICDGVPSRFHGDLHFENILLNKQGIPPFTLLDWRQDFGGILEFGDLYYDFAKLMHGLLISHELISRNQFEVRHQLNRIDFDFLRKESLVRCQADLEQYVAERGFDVRRVRVLTALIFLNIAALHHYPYSLLLFYLGKSQLFEILRTER